MAVTDDTLNRSSSTTIFSGVSYNMRCKMNLVIVCIKDLKGENYSQPWFVSTAASAVRSFTDLINNPEKSQTMFDHPQDFQLFEMGVFDDNTGVFQTHPIPKHLVSGESVKKEKPLFNRSQVAAV